MTEQEYITATNLAKIRIINEVLRDVMHGGDYGVNYDDYTTAVQCLHNIQDVLFNKIKIKE